MSRIVALAGQFDLNHGRLQIAQHHRTIGASKNAREIDNDDACQCRIHNLTLSW